MKTTNKVPRAPRVYVIDVCRTCGKQAKWPFCEHHPESMGAESWCEPIVVKEVRTFRGRRG